MAVPPPRKVLFTMTAPGRLGGSEAMLLTFLSHVDRSRIEPMVVFLGPGELERAVAGLGFRTAVLEPGRLRYVHRHAAAIVRLAALIRRERPDLVVNWLTKAQFYGGPAAALAGRRRRNAWWQHDIPGPTGRLAALLPTRAVGATARHVAAAQGARRPRRPTFAVHPGVEPAPDPDGAQTSALRAELGVPAGRAVVGIVGRLVPWKGQHRFLEALASLRRSGRDVHGVVVGSNAYDVAPGYDERLRAMAEEPDLRGAVTFTGQVGSAAPYMRMLDVMVSASDREPFGLVIMEAMALGVPVVAVDDAGPREMIESGRSGLLVEPNRPDALAAAVGRLLDDAGLREEMVEAGRARVAESFTLERMVDEMQAKLLELAASANR